MNAQINVVKTKVQSKKKGNPNPFRKENTKPKFKASKRNNKGESIRGHRVIGRKEKRRVGKR